VVKLPIYVCPICRQRIEEDERWIEQRGIRKHLACVTCPFCGSRNITKTEPYPEVHLKCLACGKDWWMAKALESPKEIPIKTITIPNLVERIREAEYVVFSS